MVTALGTWPRERHTVPWPYELVGEGMSAGYIAECGERCMEALPGFMADLPWCRTCSH